MTSDTTLSLCTPSPADAAVDVVFVHGLDGSATETWLPRNAASGSPTWPDWLAHDMPSANVWVAGYPSTWAEWQKGGLPLERLAENLAQRLTTARIGERPVVWVGHSMGGLLIKELLLRSHRGGQVANRPLWQSTHALVFLGTPHLGSGVGSLKVYLSWLATAFLPVAAGLAAGPVAGATVFGWQAVCRFVKRKRPQQSSQPNAHELERHAPALLKLNADFKDMVMNRHNEAGNPRRWPWVAVYVETEKIMGSLVVDRSSADPGIHGAEVVDLPGMNHKEICKPVDRQHLPHQWLMHQLPKVGDAAQREAVMRHQRVFFCHLGDAKGAAGREALALALWLRGQGVCLVMDNDLLGEVEPKQGWPAWAADEMAKATKVLVVGAAGCAAAFDAPVPTGLAAVHHTHWARHGPSKFLPVLLDNAPLSDLPGPLQDHWSLHLRFPSGNKHVLAALFPSAPQA